MTAIKSSLYAAAESAVHEQIGLHTELLRTRVADAGQVLQKALQEYFKSVFPTPDHPLQPLADLMADSTKITDSPLRPLQFLPEALALASRVDVSTAHDVSPLAPHVIHHHLKVRVDAYTSALVRLQEQNTRATMEKSA